MHIKMSKLSKVEQRKELSERREEILKATRVETDKKAKEKRGAPEESKEKILNQGQEKRK